MLPSTKDTAIPLNNGYDFLDLTNAFVLWLWDLNFLEYLGSFYKLECKDLDIATEAFYGLIHPLCHL